MVEFSSAGLPKPTGAGDNDYPDTRIRRPAHKNEERPIGTIRFPSKTTLPPQRPYTWHTAQSSSSSQLAFAENNGRTLLGLNATIDLREEKIQLLKESWELITERAQRNCTRDLD